MNLKELAAIKIKADLYTKLYKEQADQIKEEMKKENKETITEGDLTITLQTVNKREFNVEGVRQALGDNAKNCIEETVSSKKFDILTKKKDKYLINEELLIKCYTTTETHSLVWDGLDIYKSKLAEAKHG